MRATLQPRRARPAMSAETPGSQVRITLLGKPGCHLCDQARVVVARVAADLHVDWQEIDILSDPELSRTWWDQIPVTLVDGIQHDYWHVDEDRLRRALTTPPR